MGKRASNQAPVSKAKVAKADSSPSKAATLPWHAELELLKMTDLPSSCKQMLQAMLPHCLGTPEAERHDAQKALADTFDKIFAGLECEKQSAVATAQEALHSSEAELAPLTCKIDVAKTEFDQKAAEASEADMAQQRGPTTEAVSEAKSALQAAKEQQGGLVGERDAAEVRKAEIAEKAENVWKPLREGTVTPASKMQKELRVISEVFKKHCGAEESFLVGLAAALQGSTMKGAAASSFGAKVLQYADGLLQQKIQECANVIDGFEERSAESAKSVASAEARLAEAAAAHDVVVNVHIDAQNRLAKAQEQLSDAKDQAKSMELKVSEAQVELGAAEEHLKVIREFIAARSCQEETAEKAAAQEVAKAGA